MTAVFCTLGIQNFKLCKIHGKKTMRT